MSLIDLASLVLAPTATKEGKVYSAIPDTGSGDMTFSRGSGATRINSAGLIEKERGNLLLQSNSFDTTWSVVRATETQGAAGYDGSNDAWTITPNATNDSHSISQASWSTSSGLFTVSIYAKANGYNYFTIRDSAASNNYGLFDLSQGTSRTSGTYAIDTTITAITDGWYRCQVVFNRTAGGSNNLVIYVNDTDTTIASYSGDGTSGIIFMDSQANQGLVAQSYIETTTSAVYEGITDDVPRVDYSGGGCPSLKLEPQRTNLFPQSEYFGGWNISGTITTNTATSPEGVQNASTFTTSAAGEDLRDNTNVTGTYTFSVFVKLVDVGGIRLRIDAATDANAYFDLSDGSVFSSDGIIEADAIDYGNNWWRVYMVANVTNTQKIQIFTTDGTTSYANGSVYLYGAQFELGSYSTSYIPTYSVSSTRVADSCSKTGISELIGQSEGTLFVEVDLSKVPSENRRFLAIGDGTVSNRIGIGQQSGTSLESFVVASGSLQAIFTQSGTTAQVYKIAIAYASNDFVMYVDGSQVGTDTSGSVPSTSNVYVGVSEITPTTTQVSDGIKQAILFPTRLTNDQLEELTK